MIDMSGLATLPIAMAQGKRIIREQLLQELYESGVISAEQFDEWKVKITIKFSNDVDACLEARVEVKGKERKQ